MNRMWQDPAWNGMKGEMNKWKMFSGLNSESRNEVTKTFHQRVKWFLIYLDSKEKQESSYPFASQCQDFHLFLFMIIIYCKRSIKTTLKEFLNMKNTVFHYPSTRHLCHFPEPSILFYPQTSSGAHLKLLCLFLQICWAELSYFTLHCMLSIKYSVWHRVHIQYIFLNKKWINKYFS